MRKSLFLCFSIIFFSLAELNGSGVYPSRIISLSPSITESLYLLGAEDKLVGCTIYCERPPEAKLKEKIGTAIEVSLEKVVSLRPDLVIATSLTDRRAKEMIKELGIRVITFPAARSFDELCQQFLELGNLVGKEKEAKRIISNSRSAVDSIRESVEMVPKPRVFVQIGAKPLVTVNRDSFINDFIEFAGGENIALDSKRGLYSIEKVITDNPDVIIIVTMGIAGERLKQDWAGYKVINASRRNRIHIMDSYELCSPTPESFPDTLKQLNHILHPQAPPLSLPG